MHSLLELWHPEVANIKISSVKLIVDCDFPWMGLMELLQLLDPSASWVIAVFMSSQKISVVSRTLLTSCNNTSFMIHYQVVDINQLFIRCVQLNWQ